MNGSSVRPLSQWLCGLIVIAVLWLFGATGILFAQLPNVRATRQNPPATSTPPGGNSSWNDNAGNSRTPNSPTAGTPSNSGDGGGFFTNTPSSSGGTRTDSFYGGSDTGSRQPSDQDDLQSRGLGVPYVVNNRVRPPMPSKHKADNYYPQGFLRPSVPSTEQTTPNSPAEAKPTPGPEEKPQPNSEVKPEEKAPAPGMDPEKSSLIYALLVAAGLAGIFVVLDYRYRVWLQAVLAQNARLLAPDATPSDFDSIIGRTSGSLFESSESIPRFFGSDNLSDSYGYYPASSSVSTLSSLSSISPFATSPESNSYDGFCVTPKTGDGTFDAETKESSDFFARGAGAVS